jgi:hypothetical protein
MRTRGGQGATRVAMARRYVPDRWRSKEGQPCPCTWRYPKSGTLLCPPLYAIGAHRRKSDDGAYREVRVMGVILLLYPFHVI